MNTELLEALDLLEREKDISREVLFEAIENSLLIACRNNFGKAENVHITMDRETCDYEVYAEKTVVSEVTDKSLEISLEDAKKDFPDVKEGDTVRIDINSKEFGRIATQNAKNAILQIFDAPYSHSHHKNTERDHPQKLSIAIHPSR